MNTDNLNIGGKYAGGQNHQMEMHGTHSGSYHHNQALLASSHLNPQQPAHRSSSSFGKYYNHRGSSAASGNSATAAGSIKFVRSNWQSRTGAQGQMQHSSVITSKTMRNSRTNMQSYQFSQGTLSSGGYGAQKPH